MNKKYTIGIIIILAIFFIGFFLLGNDGTEPIIDEEQVSNEESAAMLIPETDIIDEESTINEDTEEMTVETDEIIVEEEPKIVTYTDAGFSPKKLEISEGDTVIFVNNSKRDMWVASNIHPTHTIYPEQSSSDCLGSTFDACGGTPTNESWSFTFNKVGSWQYHDHMRASRTGVIEVK